MINWNYEWNAAYFITICTKDRECFFGEIVEGKMKLSAIGIIADIIWHEIKNHAKDIELGEFVVMPNHVHGILVLNGGGGNKDMDDNDKSNNINDNESNNNKIDNNDNNNDKINNNKINNNKIENNKIDNNVETTHALSIPPPQPPQPPPQSPPQPSPQYNNPSFAQQRFQNQGSNTVSSIIGSYKSAVSKHAHRLGFDFSWQSRFYDLIIRNDAEYQRIKDYIINNPIKWSNDKFNQTND